MSTHSTPTRAGRGKYLVLVAGVVGSLIAAAVFVVPRVRDEPAAALAPTAGAMEAMPGMDMGGMTMPTDGSVQMTADQLRQFGVTFGFVERRSLGGVVRAPGIVTFDETRLSEVAPKVGGFIERLYVDFTGQTVQAGEPLVELYSRELVAAQEDLLLAAGVETRLGAGTIPGVPQGSIDLVEMARRRLQYWDILPAQIDEILSTGQIRRTLTLSAPRSGTVVEKPVVAGQAVEPGQTLYRIADLTQVWVEAEMREADAGAARAGAAATVELSAFAGQPVEGRVEYLYPTLESETRTVKVRIAVPNPDGRVRPGMYATVLISSPSRDALTVPSEAVIDTGERVIVFVDLGGGTLTPQEVQIGLVAGGYTEILGGAEPGQRVVTSAQYILDSESHMADVMRSMIGVMGTADMGAMDMGGMEMPTPVVEP